MKVKPVKSVCLALGITVVLAGGFFWKQRRLSRNENKSAMSARVSVPEAILRSFQLVERTEDRFSIRSTFTNEEEVLELETVSEIDGDSARTLVEDGIMGIHALYAQALSAYPENLSKQVSVPARFRPEFFRKSVNGVLYNYFLLSATERFAYGATSEDVLTRRSLLGWIYCEQEQTLYKIRMFAPLATSSGKLEEFFLALSCQR
ncbi:MAG: hypothetical protein ACR2OZ_20505 [Verrucomicrobiales bacterium]